MSVHKTTTYENFHFLFKRINDNRFWTVKLKYNKDIKNEKEITFSKEEMESLAEIFREINL